MRELDRGRNIDRIDVDLQKRRVADPGFVFDLDGVVAEPDDFEIGGAKQLALRLPARTLDAAERERMVFVDQAFRHRGGGEWQVEMLDQPAKERGISQTHGRRADHRHRPPRGSDQCGRPRNRGLVCLRERSGRGECGEGFVRGRERHVLGQIEVDRALRLGQRELDCLLQRRADFAPAQRQRRLGDRPEQRVMVDPHLDAAAELVAVEIAGDRNQR